MDILSMGAFWPKRLSVVAKESMKWYPFLGQFMMMAENVFIQRKDRAKAISALAEAGLEIRRRNVCP
jgi:lysophosphatidate acyltransferase